MSGRWLCLVLATFVVGCAVVPGLGRDGPQRVGPEVELGPIPVFGDEPGHGGHMVFFRTVDGWCTRRGNGGGCVGGTGGLPTGLSGVGADLGPDQMCIETVAGKRVVLLEVVPDVGHAVTLEPLRGSEDAPVNVFAACWRPPMDDGATVRGLDAVGGLIGSERLGDLSGAAPAATAND